MPHLLVMAFGTVPDPDILTALAPAPRCGWDDESFSGNMDGSEPSWRARGETGCVGARIRLPLRVLLPCVAVCLAASGAAAIGAVCVRAVGGYVIRQADDGLRACASSMLSHGPVAVPGSGAVPGTALPVPCDMELL